MISALIFTIACLGIADPFAYKNFFVPETEKVSVVEEKIKELSTAWFKNGGFWVTASADFIGHSDMMDLCDTVEVKDGALVTAESPEPQQYQPIMRMCRAIQQFCRAFADAFVPAATPEATVVEKETPTETTKETAEAKPVVDKITEKQKAAKPEKPSAAEEKISSLIARIIEEERAATKEEIAAEEQLMQEITGLIIEETMTKIGYEFYEYFFFLWEPPEVELKHYNIVIIEKASPMWGSLVEVKIGDTTIWSRMLRPRSEEIEESAKQAIETTKEYLRNYEKHQLKTKDMMGTGI